MKFEIGVVALGVFASLLTLLSFGEKFIDALFGPFPVSPLVGRSKFLNLIKYRMIQRPLFEKWIMVAIYGACFLGNLVILVELLTI